MELLLDHPFSVRQHRDQRGPSVLVPITRLHRWEIRSWPLKPLQPVIRPELREKPQSPVNSVLAISSNRHGTKETRNADP